MILTTARLTLRRWAPADLDILVALADNRAVARNLRDQFPHPYGRSDGDLWIALCQAEPEPPLNLCIEYQGGAVGGAGLLVRGDISRKTAEIGYWLGEPFWGRGIATEALAALTEHSFATREVDRLEAHVYSWNPASARVLEKCGYVLEGRLRRSVLKFGEVCDTLIYARLRGE